jgi:hypothetical protein
MPTTSIKISQLDPISSLTGSDFFPINQSSSTKTYRSTISQLQNLFSTGSFSGSLIGIFTGSLSGSLTGTIIGTGTSPQFVGTSSFAISSSTSISSSYSNFSNSSSYALSSSNAVTASYALNATSADLSGTGTTDYIPIWTGTKTLGTTSNFYSETGYFSSTKDLKIIKNAPALFVTGSGGGYIAVRAEYNSSLYLQSAQSSSTDGWTMIVNADGANAAPGVAYDIRGTLDLVTISGSSQFFSKQVTGESTPVTYVLSTRYNGVYFWPQSKVQSLSRDGTVSIGVDTLTSNIDARLKIQVYSGSSASNPQTYHIGKAIEVTYGSGSTLNTTFCVSSSGQVIANGYSGSNFNNVSFYGSASYALSSSNAVTASYVQGSVSQYVTDVGSLGSVPTTVGASTTLTHTLGAMPLMFRVTLYCNTIDLNYSVGDEIDGNSISVAGSGNEATAFQFLVSNSSVIVRRIYSDGIYILNKTSNTVSAITPSSWSLRLYAMKVN